MLPCRGGGEKKKLPESAVSPQERVRERYVSFRELLGLNNECLELLASIQEDLQYAPPTRELLNDRVSSVFDKTAEVVRTLETLTGYDQQTLLTAVAAQRQEVERYIAAGDLRPTNFSASLSEVSAASGAEAGAKAAVLGEIKNKLRLPVPDGFVLTAHAYRQFCGIPLWQQFRDITRNLDLNDLNAVRKVSSELTELVMARPVPRAIEVALTERAAALQRAGLAVAVRSSAVGEGGEKTLPASSPVISMSPSIRLWMPTSAWLPGVSASGRCSTVCPPDCLRWKARWRCSA